MLKKSIWSVKSIKVRMTGSLSRDSAFNAAARGVLKVSNSSLVGWLQHGPKSGPQEVI